MGAVNCRLGWRVVWRAQSEHKNSKERCKRDTGHTQKHYQNNTTHDHTQDHPPHLATIEGGAATARTTSHTRVGGRKEVSVGEKGDVNGSCE